MSTNGLLNVSGVDGNGGGSGGGGSTFPGGIDKSVQFNDGGLMFGGVSSFLYDKVSATLTVNKAKPVQIIDTSNSTGTAGQVLSSTGTGLQYITPTPPTVPGAPNASVQFNNGGVFRGDAAMIFDGGAKRLIVEQIKPTVIVDKFNLIGTAGQVLSSTGTDLQYITPTPPTVPAAPSGSVQFNNGGVFGGDADFTYDTLTDTLDVFGISCTGIGANKVDANLIEPVQIVDDVSSTGTAGQLLSSTGTGIRFVNPPMTVPGAPSTSVQFNQGGVFTGDSDFTFNNVNKRLTVPAGIRTNTIYDITGGAGSLNQVLTSNGVTSTWQDVSNIVVQDAGGVNANFLIPFVDANGFVNLETDPGLVFNPGSDVLYAPGNVAIGSLSAPPHRLTVTGSNNTINGASTTGLSTLLLTDTSAPASQKQFTMQLNGPSNTGDIISIQQGAQFRPIRLNPNATAGQTRVSIGTTLANAQLQLNNELVNRKIVLHEVTNNDHQYLGFGVNSNTLRYQIAASADSHVWFAGTSGSASAELMRLSGTGSLGIGGLSGTLLTISKAALGNAAPITVPTGTYLKIGGSEFRSGASSNSYRLIGFGYNTGTNNQPAYMGYIEANGSNQSNGSLVFGTRPDHTVDAIPTERMRISPAGNVSIGNTNNTFPLEVTGTIRSTSSRPNIILDTSNSAGTAGQFLSSTGSAIEWVNPPITPAAGSNFQVQFNSLGSLAADSVFTYNNASQFLLVPNVQCSGRITPTLIQDNGSGTGGFPSVGLAGQYLAATGSGIVWTTPDEPPRYFFDTNATFQGTSGHRIYVSIQKKNTLYSVQVSMQRDGGIHFDLVSPALTVGTQIIATLPVGWRPPASVDGIGYASNNNTWASQAFNWGSLNIDTNGNIRMRSPAAGGPVTTIQPNLEQITCNIFWLSSGTVYNSDGITR
jgi:hypothetical protein